MTRSIKEDKELEAIKKAREVSGIAEDDNREFKDSVVKEAVRIGEAESRKIDSGKRRPMNAEEFNKWCGSL